MLYKELDSGALQQVEVRGLLFKDANGGLIDEIVGNGVSSDSKEVSLAQTEHLIGFYGRVSTEGSAIHSIGLITYDSVESVCD